MALVSARASVDLSPLDSVNQVVRGSTALMRTYQRVRVRQARVRIRARFAAPEDKPSYPFVWSYDKAANRRAQKWWFAHKKEGAYERTGALEAAWDVQFIEDTSGGYFQAENEASGVEYVYGEKQIPSHYLTGWPQADDVVQEEADVMSADLRNDWLFVSTGAGKL